MKKILRFVLYIAIFLVLSSATKWSYRSVNESSIFKFPTLRSEIYKVRVFDSFCGVSTFTMYKVFGKWVLVTHNRSYLLQALEKNERYKYSRAEFVNWKVSEKMDPLFEWKSDVHTAESGLDGTFWYLEGKKKDKEFSIELWSPTFDPATESEDPVFQILDQLTRNQYFRRYGMKIETANKALGENSEPLRDSESSS